MLGLILIHVSAYLVCFCYACCIGSRVASPVKFQRRHAETARCRWQREAAVPCDTAASCEAARCVWEQTCWKDQLELRDTVS